MLVGDESSEARQSKDRGVTGSLRRSESLLVKVVEVDVKLAVI